MKLLDDNWYFRLREKLPEWIARGDGAKGRLARLAIVVGGLFVLFYVASRGTPDALDPWWLAPVTVSSILVAVFALWRLIEWRRRVERRRNPPVRTLDL